MRSGCHTAAIAMLAASAVGVLLAVSAAAGQGPTVAYKAPRTADGTDPGKYPDRSNTGGEGIERAR